MNFFRQNDVVIKRGTRVKYTPHVARGDWGVDTRTLTSQQLKGNWPAENRVAFGSQRQVGMPSSLWPLHAFRNTDAYDDASADTSAHYFVASSWGNNDACNLWVSGIKAPLNTTIHVLIYFEIWYYIHFIPFELEH